MNEIEKILGQYEQFLNPGLGRLINMMSPAIEDRAEGMYIYDHTGKKYMDLYAGHGVFNLGHRHPAVIEAVKQQLDRTPLTTSKIFLSPKMGELAEKLSSCAPEGLCRAFFVNSGTEAVEAALKLARARTGRKKIIATFNAFHGKTLGSLSATGRKVYQEPFEPLIPDIVHVEYGNREALEKEIDCYTAAFMIEPLQGEGGVNVPYRGYLQDASEICKEAGALFIVDEIQTGIGRTGKMFSCQHENVTPDIMTLAKALGGGVMPIGALLTTKDAFVPFEENPFLHTSTFGGGPMACAAAIATLDVVASEGLSENAEKCGDYFIQQLKSLKVSFPEMIVEVRGHGLFIGLQLVNEGLVGHVIYELKLNGFLVLQMLIDPRVIRIEPPLIIAKEHIDSFIAALTDALTKGKDLL